MGTKYSSNAESGYNATPPADDGTVSEANKVKWSTIKTKLGDPIKSLAETINSELVTHFDHGPTALVTNTTLGASHYEQFIQVSGSGVTLTLSDAATLGAGWNCEIHSTDSSNDVAIARATASDTINSLSNNFVLLPLQSVKVFVNAAANGFIIRDFGNSQSTNALSAVGPSHTLYRNSASPEANDLLGSYNFDGEDSAGNRETYARIFAQIDDPGSTTEDGSLKFSVMKAGTLTLAATLSQTTFNLASGWTFQQNGINIGGLVKLNSGTVSAAATLDIVMASYTSYPNKILVLDSFLPASDGVILQGRVSTDGGSNYDAGASDYSYATDSADEGGARSLGSSGGATLIAFTNADGTGSANISNASTNGVSATITMYHTTSTSLHNRFEWRFSCITTGSRIQSGYGSGRRKAAQDTDAFRVLFSSGNIASGNWTLYGYG